MKPKIVEAKSYPVSLFIGGDYDKAVKSTREYCDKYPWCFTVTKTKYVYTGGEEDGLIIGLINYPRIQWPPHVIRQHAIELGKKLIVDLDQQSFSVQDPHETVWYSWRPGDIEDEQQDN